MKKILVSMLLLVMILSLTGCTKEHSNEMESNFYYGYIGWSDDLNNNDIIKIIYFDDGFDAPHIRFEIKYIHRDKVFMGTYDPEIKFEYLTVQVYLDNILWDYKNITELSEDNIEISKSSTFWYGYNTYVAQFSNNFDSNFQKGKYRIDIVLSITVDDEKFELKDELNFEVIEDNLY